MRRLCGLAVGLLLLTAPAAAHEAGVRDGTLLLATCREDIRSADGLAPPTFGGGLCLGFVTGVADMHALYHTAYPETIPLFCKPEGLKVEQAVRVVIRFLETHPEQLHFGAAVLITQALQEAFPCPSPPAPPAPQR